MVSFLGAMGTVFAQLSHSYSGGRSTRFGLKVILSLVLTAEDGGGWTFGRDDSFNTCAINQDKNKNTMKHMEQQSRW